MLVVFHIDPLFVRLELCRGSGQSGQQISVIRQVKQQDVGISLTVSKVSSNKLRSDHVILIVFLSRLRAKNVCGNASSVARLFRARQLTQPV